MVYKVFDKKTEGGVVKNENVSKKELAEELQKSTRKVKNRKGILTFYRKYLGCWSNRYAIDKQI